jgi:S-adenosylmethionine-diacylglycerol 3-amino-3-carboxypropyl transferase
VPPYLSESGASVLRAGRAALTLVDGSYLTYLRDRAPRSVHGFALSNICEWMTDAEVGELFGEIARVAAPGARVCFRNFLGHTEVPAAWSRRVVEDREWGAALVRRDRSVVQSRVAVCRVVPGS